MVTRKVSTRRDFLAGFVAGALYLSSEGAFSSHTDASQSESDHAREHLLERYHNERVENPEYRTTFKKNSRIRKQHNITFPSSVNVPGLEMGNAFHTINFKYYPARDANIDNPKHPIIIVPALNGEGFIETNTRDHFWDRGYPVIVSNVQRGYLPAMDEFLQIVESEEDIPELVKTANRLYEQSLLDHMQIIDVLGSITELDTSKICCSGYSLGGIESFSWMGVDDRVTYGSFGGIGGGINTIIAHSKLKEIKEGRDIGLRKIGKSQQWLENALVDQIFWDPIHFAHHINPENVYIVLAGKDEVIPLRTGRRLIEKMKGEKLPPWDLKEKIDPESLPGDFPRWKVNRISTHISMVMGKLNGIMKDSYNFFDEKFKEDEELSA